jgi:hypothetical protein
MALSGDAERVSLRLVSPNQDMAPPGPDQLEGLLALLEDFLTDPPEVIAVGAPWPS